MTAAVRLGLVGAGRWGRNYIRTIAASPMACLAAVASANPATRGLVPADCRMYPDWGALLQAAGLDGIVIATPPDTHATIATAAIDLGLPVLIEKPLTLDLPQAEALLAHATERRALVRVGHTHLYHPAWRALKAAAPQFGSVRGVSGEAGNRGPFRTDAAVLWDWGAHDVALCLDLLDVLPAHVEARCVAREATAEGVGEVIELDLRFPESVEARLRFGNLLPRTRRFTVQLERAVLVYDDLARHKLTAWRPDAVQAHSTEGGRPLPCGPELPLARVVDEFAAAIASDDRDLRDLRLGAQVVGVLSRCEVGMLSWPA